MSDALVNLSDLGRDALRRAGTKAAMLGELIQREFPVPKGFCILASAYDEFLQSSGIAADVEAFHRLDDEQAMAEAADAIAVAIEEAPIPPELAVALSTAYRGMGSRPRVAVRPSVAYGDTWHNPISGKIEHHLNVVGEKDLYQAIRNTWAGLWDPVIALSYRRASLDHDKLRAAVIVQAMVRPISSGTVLTADPVNGETDKLLITAGWGMKQDSLAGQVFPDTYHVDRETLSLRYKRIVTKDLMVSATGLVAVPKNKKNAVVLKETAVRDLCQMATGIEAAIGTPAEVEWCALQGGALQVIDAKPLELESHTKIEPFSQPAPAPKPAPAVETPEPEVAAEATPPAAEPEPPAAEPEAPVVEAEPPAAEPAAESAEPVEAPAVETAPAEPAAPEPAPVAESGEPTPVDVGGAPEPTEPQS